MKTHKQIGMDRVNRGKMLLKKKSTFHTFALWFALENMKVSLLSIKS